MTDWISKNRQLKMKITTLIKVTDVDLNYHSYEGCKEPHGVPYTQISIGGFILLGVEGCVLDAGIQINAEYGFTDNVRKIKEQFASGTIHWIESEDFFFEGDRISFYKSNFKPIDEQRFNDINLYFPVEVDKDGDLAEGEFYVSGRIYREGTGKFFGYKMREKC